jgi:hypothetical protein
MRVAIRFSLAFLLLTTACFGAGRIKGKVVDKRTIEPLVDTRISIPGDYSRSVAGFGRDNLSQLIRNCTIPASFSTCLHIKEGRL